MRKITGYTAATVIALFLSYTGFANLVKVLHYKQLDGLTFNYELLFFRHDGRLFVVATIIGLLPLFYYFTVRFYEKYRLSRREDREDFNELMTKRQARKKYLPLTFSREGIYLTARDKLQIRETPLRKKWNAALDDRITQHPQLQGLEHLKMQTRMKWTIGDNDQYFRAGFPVMSRKNRIWVDPTDSHSLTLGTTNSGKTMSVMLPLINIVRMAGESAVVVDMKGELSQMTYDDLVADGYRVLMLDFITPEDSDGWNPLHMAWIRYRDEKHRAEKVKRKLEKKLRKERSRYVLSMGSIDGFDAEKALGTDENGNPNYADGEIQAYPDYSAASEIVEDVCNSIMRPSNGSKDNDIWNNLAADLMKGIVYLLLEEGHGEYISIPSVMQTFNTGAQPAHRNPRPGERARTCLQEYVRLKKTEKDLSFQKLKSYLDAPEETAGSIATTFLERLNRILLNTQVNNVLAKNEIDLLGLDDRKTFIFLKVHDEKDTYYPLVNIFMQQLQQSLIETARGYESLYLKYPFNFIWDEFGNFPHYEPVFSLLGAGRSRGIRLHLVVQGYEQLDMRYGKDGARTIKNNCMIKAYLLADDQQTLDEVSKSAGHRLRRKYENGKWVEEKVPIFTPERLKKFQYGDVLILRQKEQPFMTKLLANVKYVYYKPHKHAFDPKPHSAFRYFAVNEAYQNEIDKRRRANRGMEQ